MDLYVVLGVGQSASEAEIKRKVHELLGLVQLAIPCTLSVVCARVLKAPEVAQIFLTVGILIVLENLGTSTVACEQLGQALTSNVKVQSTLNPNFRRVDVVVTDAAGMNLVSLSTVVSRY